MTIASAALFVYSLVLTVFIMICFKTLGEQYDRYLNFRDYSLRRMTEFKEELDDIWAGKNGKRKERVFNDDEKPPDM